MIFEPFLPNRLYREIKQFYTEEKILIIRMKDLELR